jgi:hypothetical protein
MSEQDILARKLDEMMNKIDIITAFVEKAVGKEYIPRKNTLNKTDAAKFFGVSTTYIPSNKDV